MNRLGIARPGVDQFQEYSYTFQGILASRDFDLIGGDDRLRDLRIEVVESPTIDKLTLRCEYPAYMDRTPRDLPHTGVMHIAVGTKVIADARTNKDLVAVRIDTIVNEEAGPSETLHSDGDTAGWRAFEHTCDALSEDTTLPFTLTDTDGIESREPIRLALVAVPDLPPQLTARLDGIGSQVTAEARLPVVGRVIDDYGIDTLRFEYGIDEQEPAEQPIAELPQHPTELPLDAAMELEPLGLVPGQQLLVAVKAADRYDLAQGPNVGTSDRWLLEIVTPEDLRLALERRELMLRQRFESIVREVTETGDLLLDIRFASVDESESADETEETEDRPDDVEETVAPVTMRMLRIQRAVQNGRKNAHETLGVAEAFDDIQRQLINNRIDTPELNQRLDQGIARPLHNIVDEMFPELQRRLAQLQEHAADNDTGPRLRDEAKQQVDRILRQMNDVLERMLELESFNEAVELLRAIIELQEELGNQTQERQKQKLRELLE